MTVMMVLTLAVVLASTGVAAAQGKLAAPSTAYLYNWNTLPIGQVLWPKELESYVAFPPMQDPASYNLTQVLEQGKKMGHHNPSE